MANGLKEAVESRLNEMRSRRVNLSKSWAKYINAVEGFVKERRGRDLSEYERMNIAQCLENCICDAGLRQKNTVFEATYSDNIAFLGIQLPVIAALLPSLVLNEIAIVQALDRRQGAVFYLDVRYGTTKGEVVAGTDMVNSKTGHNRNLSGRRYATDRIVNELLGTGDGSTKTFVKANVDFYPMTVGTVVPSAAGNTETWVDNGAGVLTGSAGGTGTYAPTTGAVSVTFHTAPLVGVPVYIAYRFNMDRGTSGIGEVDVNLTSEVVAAEDFKLKANFSLGSAIDLEKAHGLNLENELVKFLGGEIKFEIDHMGIDVITAAAESADAATPIGTWAGNPTSGQEWLWKKYELLDQLEKGSNYIFAKTLRTFGNVIICGNNIARVIKQLSPHFKPAAGLGKTRPTGPMVIGDLDGRLVVQDPFLALNRYYMGYKGESFLFAGMIYAPYIPLFATPTLITADTMAQKGFYSAAGFKLINSGMYTYGDVSGLL